MGYNRIRQGKRLGMFLRNKWRQICDLKKKKKELENKAKIRKEMFIGNLCRAKETEIIERQNKAGGKRDASLVELMVKNGRHYLFWAIVLTIASIVAIYYSLAPFEFGPIVFFMVLGFAGVIICGFHTVLKSYYESKWIIFAILSLVVAMAIFGHVHLSLIRGEIFKTIYQNSNVFYAKGVQLLRLALPFLSLAIEIGAGVMLFLALENLWSPDVCDHKHIDKYQKRMIKADSRIEYLKNQPEIEALEFTEGALEGEEMLPQKLKGEQNKVNNRALLTPILIVIIILLVLFVGKAFGRETENLSIVVLDLSKSSSASDYQGKTEFQKNLEGVEKVIKIIEPDTRLVVIGITSESFSNPLIILDVTIPRKPGFFKEKIKAAREELLKEWQDKIKNIKAKYKQSDIFGAIMLAANLMENGNCQFFLYTDLRHYALGFDLGSPSKIDSASILIEIEKQGLIPSLHDVEVYCLGVHSRNKSLIYWNSLKKFWQGYFEKAGAVLKKYSILREL